MRMRMHAVRQAHAPTLLHCCPASHIGHKVELLGDGSVAIERERASTRRPGGRARGPPLRPPPPQLLAVGQRVRACWLESRARAPLRAAQGTARARWVRGPTLQRWL